MEVHHSAKHIAGKKFKEYFLEFLMIFLAVTLGFFAESLRESINDKEKEKEYIHSLIQNLQDDTTRFNYCIKDNEWKLKNLKELISFSHKNLSDLEERKSFYNYNRKSIGFYSVFISNDATMLQLKNSGGLRFIRKDHVADSIAEYDAAVKSVYAAQILYTTASDQGILATHEILDNTVYYDSSYFKNDSFTNKPLLLLSNDPKKTKWYFNKVSYEIGATVNYLNNLRQRIPYAVRMIAFLKKEYDIE